MTHEFVDWVQQSYLLQPCLSRSGSDFRDWSNASIRASASRGRQVTFSTDLIYDVLRKHEPDHLLIEAAWADARARG